MPYQSNNQLPQRDLEFLRDQCVPFLPDKLYLHFANTRQFITNPVSSPSILYFSVDQSLKYAAFYNDFGPNSISQVLVFIERMNEYLKEYDRVVVYCSSAPDKRANAAWYMCAYLLLQMKYTPDEAHAPIASVYPPFVPYRDAGYGPNTYSLTIIDCLNGLYKAMAIGLVDIKSIDPLTTDFYERVENGDMNWFGRKFLALASPKDERSLVPGTPVVLNDGIRRLYSVAKIEHLITYFKENGITTIIRLNNELYDRQRFLDAGIQHIDLYFPDGSNPPDAILRAFLSIAENTPGAIAVHCKAGLGRTGSLIAAYFMKHYLFSASHVIGLLRVLRPGSVVGPQQNWLAAMQTCFWNMHPAEALPLHISGLYKREDIRDSGISVSGKINGAAGVRALEEYLSGPSDPSAAPSPMLSTANQKITLELSKSMKNTMINSKPPLSVGLMASPKSTGSAREEPPMPMDADEEDVRGLVSPVLTELGTRVEYAIPVQPRKQHSNPSLFTPASATSANVSTPPGGTSHTRYNLRSNDTTASSGYGSSYKTTSSMASRAGVLNQLPANSKDDIGSRSELDKNPKGTTTPSTKKQPQLSPVVATPQSSSAQYLFYKKFFK